MKSHKIEELTKPVSDHALFTEWLPTQADTLPIAVLGLFLQQPEFEKKR